MELSHFWSAPELPELTPVAALFSSCKKHVKISNMCVTSERFCTFVQYYGSQFCSQQYCQSSLLRARTRSSRD